METLKRNNFFYQSIVLLSTGNKPFEKKTTNRKLKLEREFFALFIFFFQISLLFFSSSVFKSHSIFFLHFIFGWRKKKRQFLVCGGNIFVGFWVLFWVETKIRSQKTKPKPTPKKKSAPHCRGKLCSDFFFFEYFF